MPAHDADEFVCSHEHMITLLYFIFISNSKFLDLDRDLYENAFSGPLPNMRDMISLTSL